MPVTTKHPMYEKRAELWEKCRDAIEGEEAIKARAEKYLPRLEGQKIAEFGGGEGGDGYEAYKTRAMYYEAPSRTVSALTGMVMRKPPRVSFPEEHKKRLERIGRDGSSLDQLNQSLIEEEVGIGRLGLLTDAASGQNGEPFVTFYFAEKILNWGEAEVAGRIEKTMVVFEESEAVRDPEDPFARKSRPKWRVLRLGTMADFLDLFPAPEGQEPLPAATLLGAYGLTESDFERKDGVPERNGRVYWQEIWRRREGPGGAKDELFRDEIVVPRRWGGRVLHEIPFDFVNPMDLEAEPKAPPIKALVNVSLSHYRNSADLEHGRHYTALPTPWAAGFPLPKGATLEIGSRAAWVSPETGAHAGMLEFTGAGLGHLKEGMEHKERLMAVLGARLLEEQPKGVEAAETVKLRQAAESSTLATIAQTASEAMTRALRRVEDWVGWQGNFDEISVEFNRDFNVVGIPPQLLLAMMQAVQGGAMSWDAFFHALEKGEVYPDGWSIDDEVRAIRKGLPMPSMPGGRNDDEDDGGGGGSPDGGSVSDEDEGEEGTGRRAAA